MSTQEKPRIRVGAGQTKFTTVDSFINFANRVGWGANNSLSNSGYSAHFVTRNRQQLDWIYRGSWIAGKAVDCVADDMTRAGVTVKCDDTPEDIEKIYKAARSIGLQQSFNETIKWGRLYGGAIGVFLIDGQNVKTPLRIDAIKEGQFKGMLVFDRWMVTPSDELVTEYGPYLGTPMYYTVMTSAPAFSGEKIHYSRCLRTDGVKLPYWQKQYENGWSMSVIERLWDRLIMFDSTTTGAAQLVYRAHLRVLKVKKMREIIALGGPAQTGLVKQLAFMRATQDNEHITMVDAEDEFEAHQYTFSGLSDMIAQASQQLSGACDTPLTRMFGQSPAGMNATGESDTRNYYDMIDARRESDIRMPTENAYKILYASVLGRAAPDSFSIEFNPLWQLSDVEKADVAAKNTATVISAYDDSLIGKAATLRELRTIGEETSVFSNITDEMIADAEDEDKEAAENPPLPLLPPGQPQPGNPPAPPGKPLAVVQEEEPFGSPDEEIREAA